MTITSYDAERELVSGPVADTVLSRLEGTGVVGLSLAVGPLRRPFAAGEPLLGPEDWQGARFRAFNSPVQADTIAAWAASRSISASAGSTKSPPATCAASSSTSPSTTTTG